MSEPQLERSVLEAKEREELYAIADALGTKPGSRARKSDLILQILRATGVVVDDGDTAKQAAATTEAGPPAEKPRRAVRARKVAPSPAAALPLDDPPGYAAVPPGPVADPSAHPAPGAQPYDRGAGDDLDDGDDGDGPYQDDARDQGDAPYQDHALDDRDDLDGPSANGRAGHGAPVDGPAASAPGYMRRRPRGRGGGVGQAPADGAGAGSEPSVGTPTRPVPGFPPARRQPGPQPAGPVRASGPARARAVSTARSATGATAAAGGANGPPNALPPTVTVTFRPSPWRSPIRENPLPSKGFST